MHTLQRGELPEAGTVCKQEGLLAVRVAQAAPLCARVAGASAVLLASHPGGRGATAADGHRCQRNGAHIHHRGARGRIYAWEW